MSTVQEKFRTAQFPSAASAPSPASSSVVTPQPANGVRQASTTRRSEWPPLYVISDSSYDRFQFGLHVRVTRPTQPGLFQPGDLSVYEQATELCLGISDLRFRDFRLRYQIQKAAKALLSNASFGFWDKAEIAAVDIAGMLREAGRRRVAHPETCWRGERFCYRIAEACERASRKVVARG